MNCSKVGCCVTLQFELRRTISQQLYHKNVNCSKVGFCITLQFELRRTISQQLYHKNVNCSKVGCCVTLQFELSQQLYHKNVNCSKVGFCDQTSGKGVRSSVFSMLATLRTIEAESIDCTSITNTLLGTLHILCPTLLLDTICTIHTETRCWVWHGCREVVGKPTLCSRLDANLEESRG